MMVFLAVAGALLAYLGFWALLWPLAYAAELWGAPPGLSSR